jgi:hypothetical protein
MVGPQEFLGRNALKEELQALRDQEQELETLRALVAPDHWPRVYTMLTRIRMEIRRVERLLGIDERDIA